MKEVIEFVRKLSSNKKFVILASIILLSLIIVIRIATKEADDAVRIITTQSDTEIEATFDTEIGTENIEVVTEIGTENIETTDIDIKFESIVTEDSDDIEDIASETEEEIVYEEPVYEEPICNYVEINPETYGQEDPYIPYRYPGVDIALSDDEVYRLAGLVQAEADNLYECKTAIASLFINRMIFYNQSFYETLYAPGQFVTAWGTIAYADPQPDTIQAVYDVLNYGRTIPPYVMFYKIQGYHNWGDQVGWDIIGTTYFSYSYAHRVQIEGGC